MVQLNYLLFNIFLNFAIILAYILTLRFLNYKNLNNKNLEKIIIGIIFSIGIIITTNAPLKIQRGITFDSETIFILIPTLLYGEIAGILPSLSGIAFRELAGYKGETTSILLIITTYLIGLFFYHLLQKKQTPKYRYFFMASLIVQILITAIITIFTEEKSLLHLWEILPITQIILLPFITTIFGILILESKKWEILKKKAELQHTYLNTLFNKISEIVISANSEKKITFANKNAIKFFQDKLIGQNCESVIILFDKNKNKISKSILETVYKKKEITLKDCFIQKGIKLVPIEGNVSPLIERGKTKGCLFTFIDVSEKIEKEKLIKEVLERISDGIESYDNNWNYTFANHKAAKLLGKKSPEELIGKNKLKLEPEVIGTPFYNACIQALKTQKPVFMEHYFKPWNKWFENRIYPSKNGITVFFTDITERKKLEEKINELNEDMKTIFKLNPAMIFVWDAKNRKTLFVSDNIKQLFGYSREEAMENYWWRKIVHKEDSEKALFNSDRVYIEGNTEQRFRIHKKDGSIAWVLEKQILIEDKEQNRKTVYGTWIDITELMKISEELKEEQEAFKHLFENRFVPMLLIEPASLKIIEANNAACMLYGYSKQEFREKITFHDLDSNQRDSSEIKWDTKSIIKLEATHKKANGKEIFVEIYGIPYSRKGKDFVFAIIHDISEKKKIEKELIESESRFFLAFQSSPIATAISSLSEGKFVDVNPAFEKISGYSKQEIIGKTSLELNLWANPEDRKKLIEKLKKQRFVLNEKTLFQNRNGENIHALTTTFILKNDIMFSFVVDISELVKLQNELEIKVRERTAKLEELNEELKEFTQSLIHDLKEPLRTIKNFSELILENCDFNKPSLEKHLSLINSASLTLEKMISELYEFARLEREQFTLARVSLDRAIEGVINMLDAKLKESKAEIYIPQELGMVYGNTTLLTRTFQNIIENSIKYCKEGVKPQITITSQKTNSTITVIISDNGIGIKEEYLNKVFFPFVRANNKKSDGLGMGLAIVKKSMELMGGNVRIKSKLNKGTQIYLTFRL